MKVFTMRAKQRREAAVLKASIVATAAPYQAAQTAFTKFLDTVTSGESKKFPKVQISDDGVYLVLTP